MIDTLIGALFGASAAFAAMAAYDARRNAIKAVRDCDSRLQAELVLGLKIKKLEDQAHADKLTLDALCRMTGAPRRG